MKNSIKIATGFVAGTLLGASMALLFAPKKGTKTRKLIGDQAKNIAETAGKTYEETIRRMGLIQDKNVKVAV